MTQKLINSEHYQKIIKWVDGVPLPAFQVLLKSSGVQELPLTVLSLPYKRTPQEIEKEIDVEFSEMTNGEVAMIRVARQAAGGDLEALKILLDRILGKPKFQAEIKSLHVTYQDFLDEIERKEGNSKAPDENDL